MGLSVSGVTVVIGVSILIIVEIFTASLLPVVTDIRSSYEDMTDRMIEQVQTEIDITDITSAWWNQSWNNRKMITIDHTKVISDVYNFPILINITDSDLKNRAQSDGDDIVFIDSNNKDKYSHEIELYDNNNGHLVAWIKIPRVRSSRDTQLYMYYNNSDVSNQEDITGTWDSNYAMVQHLNESSGTLFDSSSNNNDGSVTGASANSSSKIDGGYDFDGSDDFVNCGTSTSLNITSQITLEAWVKDPPILEPKKKTSNVRIVDKRDEKRPILPGRSFSVKRTVSADDNAKVIFVALFSQGISLFDMSFKIGSVYDGVYFAGMPDSEVEEKIENFRQVLPDELKELSTIAYSKPFSIQDETTIQMNFNAEGWYNLFSNGRISYLVFSIDDGCFDFEGTTHWNNLFTMEKWDPFSFIFEFFGSLLTGKTTEESTNKTKRDSIILLPESVKTALDEYGEARVIIRFNEQMKDDSTELTRKLKEAGFETTVELDSRGIVAGVLDKEVFDTIKDSMDLEVFSDEPFEVLLEESLPLIHFDEAVQEFNVTGEGIRICILDTGVDDSVVNFSFGYDFVNEDSEPDDKNGHGSRVASVIKSIAPDAEIIVAKVIGDEGVGFESDVLEGLEWCIAQDPDIISFSIGSSTGCYGFCDKDLVVELCHEAVEQGIFVIAASGNDESKDIVIPACGSNVFSVGATDDNDNIAGFSNVNPSLDLFAPGVNIETVAGTGSGTSMSVPHASGAAALILEYELLSPYDLKYRLRSTGKPINYVYNDSLSLDIARLDVYNALANFKTIEPYDYLWWLQASAIANNLTYTITDTMTLYVDGDGTTVAWDDFPLGGDDYQDVDDQPGDDGDTTYVYTSKALTEEFNHDNTGLGAGTTINFITVYTRMKYEGDFLESTQVQIGVNSGGTQSYSSNKQLNGGAFLYSTLSEKFTTNPADGEAWEISDVDAVQSSMKFISGTQPEKNVRCTQAYIIVDYTPVSNTAPALSGESPSNESSGVSLTTNLINVTIEDPDGDGFNWTIETSPDVGSSGSWYDGSWGCRKLISINSSLVDADLVDFPVLVNCTDGDLAGGAQVDGDDILFVGMDNVTKYCHEIEKYVSGSGGLVAWVRVPSVSSSSNTSFWMYYGNGGCGSQQNKIGVWDSNFTLVHHFNETGDPHEDSTSFNNDGNESGGVSQGIVAMVDGGDDFAGDNDYIKVFNADSLDDDNNSFCIEFWVNPDNNSTLSTIIDHETMVEIGNYDGYWVTLYDNGTIEFAIYENTSISELLLYSDTSLANDTWYHVAAVRDKSGGKTRLYINGVEEKNRIDTFDGLGVTSADPDDVYFGALYLWGFSTWVNYFDGTLDEIRLSNALRNSSWINTSYNSMNSPSSFLSYGSEGTEIGDINGSKTCSVSGLQAWTVYTWYVNVSDGSVWTNETYTFTTMGNTGPVFSSESPSNTSTGVSKFLSSISVTVNDDEGDSFDWTIETVPGVGSNSGNGEFNGSKSCSVSGFSYSTTYTWYVNASDGTNSSSAIYWFRTEPLNLFLINCSTDKDIYDSGDTVTFTGWVNASIDSCVVLLISSNVSNLNNCNYSSRGSCIANSSNITISSQPQSLTATMTASSDTSWYAKAFDDGGNWSYIHENTSAWNLTFDGTEDYDYDKARGVAVDSSDNVFVVGYAVDLNSSNSGFDWWVKKFSSGGVEDTTSWNKTFTSGGYGHDYAHSVVVDSDDNVTVVGLWDETYWWIQKFDSSGVRLWNYTFNAGGSFSNQRFVDVAVDSDDNVYVAGDRYNGSDYGWWVKKFSSGGVEDTTSWNKTIYGGDIDDCKARSVAVDSDDNVYVAGYTVFLSPVDTRYDWWVKKFSSGGVEDTVDWNKTFTSPNLGSNSEDYAYSVSIDRDDNVFVVGVGDNMISSSSGDDWWVKKFSSGGVEDTVGWNRSFGVTGNDVPYSVFADVSGNVYVVGTIYTSYDGWVKKFLSNGSEDLQDWNGSYGGVGGGEGFMSVVVDSFGDVYVVGYMFISQSGGEPVYFDYDWWVKKFEYVRSSFTTNHAPVLSGETPTNESIDVSISTSSINVTIEDPDGDSLDWTIETSPNIGSNSANGESNGSKSCSVSGLSSDVTYTWYVNVTDGCVWTNETYTFTTTVAKKIISKEQSAYSLELSSNGTILYGYIDTDKSVNTSIDTSWHYVALTFNGNTLTLYKDGASVSTTSWSGSISTNANNLTLGKDLSGTLDEVRVSNTARSDAWINISYKNQNSPSAFYSIGSEETEGPLHITIKITNTGKTTLKTDDFTILINGNLTTFTCPETYIYMESMANFTVNAETVGEKRIKIITDNGIAKYEIYTVA